MEKSEVISVAEDQEGDRVITGMGYGFNPENIRQIPTEKEIRARKFRGIELLGHA